MNSNKQVEHPTEISTLADFLCEYFEHDYDFIAEDKLNFANDAKNEPLPTLPKKLSLPAFQLLAVFFAVSLGKPSSILSFLQ